MIQTEIQDSRGEMRQLTPNDAEYWEGPYRYEPYPKAMYRQNQPGEACETAVVKSDSERVKLGSDWFESPADAQEHFQKLEADIAKEAAQRNYTDTLMSAKALGDALRADRSTDLLLPSIPETPKRKYVKKVKTSTDA